MVQPMVLLLLVQSMVTTTIPSKTGLGDDGETSGALTDVHLPDHIEMIELEKRYVYPPLLRRLSHVGAIAVRQLVNDDCLSIAVTSENERVIEHS